MASIAALLGAGLFAPITGYAQSCPAVAPGDHAAAETLDREGRTRFDAAEFEQAVVAWTRAHEREPRPALLYNVAVAQLRLPDADAAYLSLTRELADCGITPTQRDAAESLLVDIRQRTVEVRFVAEAPPGAHPTLDLDRRPQDPEAWTRSHWLLPGDHEARARAVGVSEAVQTFHLTQGLAATVRLRMEVLRTTGVLHVALGAPVRGASARVDHRPWGDLPQESEVEAGEHVVRVRAPGYHSTERRVSVPAGGRRDVEMVLLLELESERPHPLYTRWWFWGGSAVVIAGAVVGTYFLTRPGVRDRGGTLYCESGSCP